MDQTPNYTPAEARAMDALTEIINELSAHPDTKMVGVLSVVSNAIDGGKLNELDELLKTFLPEFCTPPATMEGRAHQDKTEHLNSLRGI